ncbi:MAG TPA: carboxypeptidase-like regulatory domain-containing protein, partial [Thermoanaerobaculia bacterium]|nr:carboxypeptidase-like regulatory domain-containing protein [Thermoanaerobaculia bacterium]
MNFTKRFAIVLALLMLVSVVASAQTTSNLTGTVTLGGNPLPGATITISSPSLQGVRTTNSDVNGNYNFGALPPGTYTIKFDMESMQTVNKTVQVTLSGTARADAEMKLTAMAEAITVTATAPAVLETTEIQTNLQQSTINHLPTQRTLQATVSLAP